MPQSKAHMEATNRWLSKAKDRITIVVDKGQKAKIREHAKKLGLSLNAYILKVIEFDMAQDD